MGEGGAFIAGGIAGGIVGAGAGYQAGYNQRDSELQSYIASLLNQLNARDAENFELRARNAELEARLKQQSSIPVISQIKKKLGGS